MLSPSLCPKTNATGWGLLLATFIRITHLGVAFAISHESRFTSNRIHTFRSISAAVSFRCLISGAPPISQKSVRERLIEKPFQIFDNYFTMTKLAGFCHAKDSFDTSPPLAGRIIGTNCWRYPLLLLCSCGLRLQSHKQYRIHLVFISVCIAKPASRAEFFAMGKSAIRGVFYPPCQGLSYLYFLIS